MTRILPTLEPTRQYCIKEVCDILNIHRDTLRKYTANQTICCIRITSREIYYTGKDIQEFWNLMQQNKQ
jgi:DNA-binding transcriptional MerR regulator